MVPLLFNSTLAAEVEKDLAFVDREIERQLCLDAIHMGEKAIILGERGTGKTALIKHIYGKLLSEGEGILPIYINLSATHGISQNSEYIVASILQELIQYVWSEILGFRFISIYDEDISFPDCSLAKQVYKTHKLLRMMSQDLLFRQAHNLEASFILKGNVDQSSETKLTYNPLTSQELRYLFCELCDELIMHNNVRTIAFLCDEANRLENSMQMLIVQELGALFPRLSCSFLYVASTSVASELFEEYTACFERVIEIKGFQDLEFSRQLIQNRILNKECLVIDNSAYEKLHKVSCGRPRYLIEIMGSAIQEKCYRSHHKRECDIVTISSEDINAAYERFTMYHRQKPTLPDK